MIDKRSFVLGMVTAFCECIASGCKRLALSPPLTHADYESFHDEVEKVIEKHGLIHYHEDNQDHPGFEWIVIASKLETISSYAALRDLGYSPVESLEPFYNLLSYQQKESIHTGYDAYREFSPLEES